MSATGNSDWRNLPMPVVFDADHAAWLKSLSRKQRVGEPAMSWSDLGPYTISAYGLHEGLASTYCFAVSKKKAPTVLPDDCTPQGFYLAAVEKRRRQVGVDDKTFVPTPYERLSAFSQFLYKQMAGRVAVAAGFSKGAKPAKADDGLGDDLDDGLGGLGDGLGEPESADDGLGSVEVADDLDDGLGGLALTSDDGLGDGL